MKTVINNTILLFDMGGVLIDYPGAGRLLKWMPEGTSEEELNRRWHGSRSIRLFESGKCDEKTFADDMIAELSFQTDRDSFLEEFRLIPGGFLPHATEILDRLKDFPTACFSNTNKLQWERLESEFGLEEHFDKCFLSYRIGLTKPDREAFLSGQIIDLQSRLNVMNLVTGDGHAQSQALLRFARLFELLGLPAAELGALQRNLARAQAAMTGSAGGDAPLLPRRFEQLVWLGLPPATLAALRPYVTLLPTQGSEATRVNLNTASAQVICAAVPELDLAAAQRLVAARERGHFKDVGSALALVPLPGGGSADTSGVAVGTQFFEVRGRLRLDQLALEEVSTVQRDPSTRQVRTLWRERRALGTPAAGG